LTSLRQGWKCEAPHSEDWPKRKKGPPQERGVSYGLGGEIVQSMKSKSQGKKRSICHERKKRSKERALNQKESAAKRAKMNAQ